MATILFTWELGGGLGHLGPLLPITREVLRSGHRVVIAARNPERGTDIFTDSSVEFVKAPYQTKLPEVQFVPPRSHAQLLHNLGFAESELLAQQVMAWQAIFEQVRPDVVVCDHSPTALVALRGYPARKAIIGNGFFVPPDKSPWPDYCPWLPVDEYLPMDEEAVRMSVNRVLSQLKKPTVQYLYQLYSEVDQRFLLTFPEADHYGPRADWKYWGVWNCEFGEAPIWPNGVGKRIFAYLAQYRQLDTLLQTLANLGNPTLVYAPTVPTEIRNTFRCNSLSFASEPLDLRLVGRTCDAAITNGNHGVALELLMEGIPALHIPITFEQYLFARRCADSRIASCLRADEATSLNEIVQHFLDDEERIAAAVQFSNRYSSIKTQNVSRSIADWL